jgi:hypothetical protein
LTEYTDQDARYAVYWLPEATHPLWARGCEWLGRDPRSGAWSGQLLRPHTAMPASYGFHATLKAPIRLAPRCTLEGLLRAVAAIAARHAVFPMPALRVSSLGRFIALRAAAPVDASHPLRELARDCVVALDPMRRPASAAELTRRRAAGLTAEAEARLARWGYPQVLEAWEFHMTLSEAWGNPQDPGAEAMSAAAQHHFADALSLPLECRSIWVCEQAAPDSPFQPRWRFPLLGSR